MQVTMRRKDIGRTFNMTFKELTTFLKTSKEMGYQYKRRDSETYLVTTPPNEFTRVQSRYLLTINLY